MFGNLFKRKDSSKNYGKLLQEIDDKAISLRRKIDQLKSKLAQIQSKIFYYSGISFILALISGYATSFNIPWIASSLIAIPLISYFANSFVTILFSYYLKQSQKQLDSLDEEHKTYFEEMVNKTKFNDIKKIVEKYETPVKHVDPVPVVNNSPAALVNSPLKSSDQPVNPFVAASSPEQINNNQIKKQNCQQQLQSSPVNQPKTWVDKIMDSIIGEETGHKYALICKNCFSHNGLVEKEEYAVAKYRCLKCEFFNDRNIKMILSEAVLKVQDQVGNAHEESVNPKVEESRNLKVEEANEKNTQENQPAEETTE